MISRGSPDWGKAFVSGVPPPWVLRTGTRGRWSYRRTELPIGRNGRHPEESDRGRAHRRAWRSSPSTSSAGRTRPAKMSSSEAASASWRRRRSSPSSPSQPSAGRSATSVPSGRSVGSSSTAPTHLREPSAPPRAHAVRDHAGPRVGALGACRGRLLERFRAPSTVESASRLVLAAVWRPSRPAYGPDRSPLRPRTSGGSVWFRLSHERSDAPRHATNGARRPHTRLPSANRPRPPRVGSHQPPAFGPTSVTGHPGLDHLGWITWITAAYRRRRPVPR